MRIASLPNFWLLLALITLILIHPLANQYAGGRVFLVLFDWVILFLALRASRKTWYRPWLGYMLAIPAMTLYAGVAVFNYAGLLVSSLFMQALFHGFVVVCLLRYMLHDNVMTLDEVFAAASLYVLAGFVFGYCYALIEHLQPGSFYINANNNPDNITSWWELLYFSFTCLTSVGFGEITPVSDSARSVVIIEQTAGVLYLALLISRLLSMQRREGR
ncbi:MAG: potassium channel protein [Nitrosomonas sp.]|nr:MAG: potassium channel protein [Nitrosomonas sp.]